MDRLLSKPSLPIVVASVNSRQLLAKRIGLVALTNLLVELNSLIMLPLLTKNLPASEYGVWVQITVTIGLVPAVALLGLPYSMVRFVPPARGREVIQEIFYTMAIAISLAGLSRHRSSSSWRSPLPLFSSTSG